MGFQRPQYLFMPWFDKENVKHEEATCNIFPSGSLEPRTLPWPQHDMRVNVWIIFIVNHFHCVGP